MNIKLFAALVVLILLTTGCLPVETTMATMEDVSPAIAIESATGLVWPATSTPASLAPVSGEIISFVPMPTEGKIYPSQHLIQTINGDQYSTYAEYGNSTLRVEPGYVRLGCPTNPSMEVAAFYNEEAAVWDIDVVGLYPTPICLRFGTRIPPVTLCIEGDGITTAAFLVP